MINRVIWIVLDSVGIGESPDAHVFNDEGANTLGHIVDQYSNINLSNMRRIGLGNIEGIKGLESDIEPVGAYGRLRELSMGKDTTVGHWEMIGIHTSKPMPVYENGFPDDIIEQFIKETGCGQVLGNKVASGTDIINELGDEHYKTGYPIVYTSADSVFQIAGAEDVIGLDKLYEMCQIARKILCGEHNVARVIARPFIKDKEEYIRTTNRRDFSLIPPKANLLEYLCDKNIDVAAVGKIEDIFAGNGITYSVHTKDNMDGVDKTLDYMESVNRGLIFTNLVEFDMKWGHRRDVMGYGKGLEEFDLRLPEIIKKMTDEDLLIITADHGCDPTYKGTDHTRECVPLLVYGKQIQNNINLGTGDTFANIGQTVAEIFHTQHLSIGESFLNQIS